MVYGFIVVGETREDIFCYIFTVNPGFNLSQYYLYVTQTLIGDGFMVSYVHEVFELCLHDHSRA